MGAGTLVYMFKGNTDDAMFHQIAPLAIQMLQLAFYMCCLMLSWFVW
jgi:hypothetical protein